MPKSNSDVNYARNKQLHGLYFQILLDICILSVQKLPNGIRCFFELLFFTLIFRFKAYSNKNKMENHLITEENLLLNITFLRMQSYQSGETNLLLALLTNIAHDKKINLPHYDSFRTF